MKAEYWKVQKNKIKHLENIEPDMIKVLTNACEKYNSNYIYVMCNLEPGPNVKMKEPISYMRPDSNIVEWCKKWNYEYKGNYISIIEKRKLKLLKLKTL